jgi:hypothetical protein
MTAFVLLVLTYILIAWNDRSGRLSDSSAKKAWVAWMVLAVGWSLSGCSPEPSACQGLYEGQVYRDRSGVVHQISTLGWHSGEVRTQGFDGPAVRIHCSRIKLEAGL